MLEQLKLLVEAGKAVGNWGKGAYDVVKPAVQWVQVGWGLLSGTGSAASGVAMNDGEVEKQKGAKAKTEDEIAEAEAKKAARGPVRKAFDKIIDVLFAPSFLRIISFISLAGLAFSPFGPIAIAIAATVSVSCMVYGVINEGKTLKNLKVQQNEGKAVEELMEMRKGQLEILANNPNLAAVLMEDISAHTTDPKKKDVPDKVVKIKNVMEGMPEMLVPFLGNVMSGNPILMGVGLFTLLTSTVANTSEQLSFSDQRDKMMDIMKQNQALLGIEFPIGKGGDFLKEQWLDNKAKSYALEQMKDTTETDPKKIREEFNNLKDAYKEKYQEHNKKNQYEQGLEANAYAQDKTKGTTETDPMKQQEEFNRYRQEYMKEHQSYEEKYEVKGGVLAHAKEAFVGSMSYDKSREIFAPMAHHDEKKEANLRAEIQGMKEDIVGIQEQRQQPVVVAPPHQVHVQALGNGMGGAQGRGV